MKVFPQVSGDDAAALGLTVLWAKGTAGSGPRRRTVLTVPQFDWAAAVELGNWLWERKLRGQLAGRRGSAHRHAGSL